MALDNKKKDLIYKAQMNQKISIYMALLSPFGFFVSSFLLILFYNDFFESITPVFILDAGIMLYFFRTFVATKKYDYEKMPFFKKLIDFRNYIRN